jgi:two-component system, NtrC family, sensor kinase
MILLFINDVDFSKIAPWVLATYFVMLFLGRFLEIEKRLPKLHQIMKFGWVGVLIGMLFLAFIGLPVHDYFLFILSMAVLYILYQSKEYPITRSLFIAIIPYIVIKIFLGILRIITPDFLSENAETIDSMEGFAVVWLVGFGSYPTLQLFPKTVENRINF